MQLVSSSTVKASQLPVEKLARASSLSETEKVEELSRQFEAILLRQILSEAQKASLAPKKNESSASKEIYQDMITNQMAEAISRSGAFGLGASLAPQLTRELKKQETVGATGVKP